MIKKLPFDALEYATLLKQGGIEHSEVHAASLAAIITQNIYTKDEVDKMIEATFQRFDTKFEATLKEMKEQTYALDKRLEERTHTLEKELHQLEARIIRILGSLIVLVGAVASFTHYFLH
jgi:Skp family chaperone for outer membrane proteins